MYVRFKASPSLSLNYCWTNGGGLTRFDCIRSTDATALKRQGVDLLSIMSVIGHHCPEETGRWFTIHYVSDRTPLSWRDRALIYYPLCQWQDTTVLKRQGVDLLSILSVTGHRNMNSFDSYIKQVHISWASYVWYQVHYRQVQSLYLVTHLWKHLPRNLSMLQLHQDPSVLELLHLERMSPESNCPTLLITSSTITGGSLTSNVFHKDNN